MENLLSREPKLHPKRRNLIRLKVQSNKRPSIQKKSQMKILKKKIFRFARKGNIFNYYIR